MLSQGPSGIHGTSAKMQRKAEEAARGRVFVRVSKQANQHVGVNMPEASQRAGLIRSCRRAEKQLFGAMPRRFNQGSRQCRQFGFGAPIVVEGDRRRCLGRNSTYQTPELVACLRLEMGSGTARGRRHRSSSAGCSLRAEEPPDWFAGREVGLAKISKRQPFKSTYGALRKDCLEAIQQWPGCETVSGIQIIRDNSPAGFSVRVTFYGEAPELPVAVSGRHRQHDD
jgi:hypothetical protein